jgi:hypothetical protein
MVGFEKKTQKLPVGGEIYISCGNLPISVHKLRIKKLVSVREVSQNEFFKAHKPKTVETKEVVVEPEAESVEESVETNEDEEETPLTTTSTTKKKRIYKKKTKKEDSTVVSTSTDE